MASQLSPEEGKSAALLVGGQAVRLMNDQHFSELRRALGYDCWLPEAVAGFDWGRMAAGGGKGGDKMARTPCKRLFVKEVSGGDLETLTNQEFLKAYVARVSTGSSLIVHVLAHFARPDGQTCLIMNNWLPPTTGITWSRLFDLKGTADDKVLLVDGEPLPEAHKRFYNLPWMCAESVACDAGAALTPEHRRKYVAGKREAFKAKFHLTAAQRASVLSSLRDDVAFLSSDHAAGGLMDYSIILGVATPPTDDALATAEALAPPAPRAAHAHPMATIHQGQLRVHYIGIIDFLQTWTTSKKVAHLIKACCAPHPISTVPPQAYARQFMQHFEEAFKDDGAEAQPPPAAAAAAAAAKEPEEQGAAAVAVPEPL